MPLDDEEKALLVRASDVYMAEFWDINDLDALNILCWMTLGFLREGTPAVSRETSK